MRGYFKRFEPVFVLGFALLLITGITLIKMQVPEIGIGSPFLLYIFVVILATSYGGVSIGIISLTVTLFVSTYYFVAPSENLIILGRVELFQILIFLVEGSVTIFILAILRQISNRLEDANQTLEQKVQARTEELQQMMNKFTTLNNKLQKSNRELEDFAYIASHDLQEPLRKIQAFTNLLRDEADSQLSGDTKLYLEKIFSSTSRMRRLIDDLLAYSRLQIKSKPFTHVSLNQLVSEVLSDMHIRIQESQATVSFHFLPDVWGDSTQLYQLFQNLLSNALRYRSPDGDPYISIFCKKANGTVAVEVRDNGQGFDEAYKEKIFAIFERLHGKSEYEGTGIGLAIVKKVVENHRGTIEVRSQIGKGSSFVISLPSSEKYYATH